MARRRQIYLVKTGAQTSTGAASWDGAAGGGGQMISLGTLAEVAKVMAGYNTAPDGSGPEGYGDALGMAVFHGPGYTVEMPTTSDEVPQAIVTLLDEDFAWSVLGKMCKEQGWRMMDPETGRTFG